MANIRKHGGYGGTRRILGNMVDIKKHGMKKPDEYRTKKIADIKQRWALICYSVISLFRYC